MTAFDAAVAFTTGNRSEGFAWTKRATSDTAAARPMQGHMSDEGMRMLQ